MEKKVNIFVIGAMKSGTSAMHQAFDGVRGFGVSKKVEPNFFLKDHQPEELDSYHALYPGEDIWVDVSPNYSKCHLFPGVAHRIYHYNPDAKIIYILRDPVERIISHLHHNALMGRHAYKRLKEIPQKHPNYIRSSKYYFQLKPYLENFGKDQVFLFLFEDLRDNPKKFLKELSESLGRELPDNILRPSGVSKNRYKIPFHDSAKALLNLFGIFPHYRSFWKKINLKVPKPSIPDETLAWVADQLQQDVECLETNLGLETNKWATYHRLVNFSANQYE